jgi:membrane protein YqaA with SNARE-associated domain
MQNLLTALFYVLARLGGFGLLIVGALDSSFLFMPLGNDLLMLGLTARAPGRLFYFAFMAAAGSVIGTAVIDWLCRKGGEQGLTRILSQRRIDFVKHRVRKRAGWAIAIAALMPPPFPFTPFVAGAAAFQYPRLRLLGVVAASRLVRFCLIGWLAVTFGRVVLQWAKAPAVRYTVLVLVAVMIIGSAVSIHGWIQRSRKAVQPV